MRNLIKFKAILFIFFICFASKSLAGNKILPIPKPTVDEKIKKISEIKKGIYPQEKPPKKTEIETIAADEEITLVEEFIYPEKKPIVVKKTVSKEVVKSNVLSPKDFKIAKLAFKAIKKRKWTEAINLSKKARDKTVYNLINYLYLTRTPNSASFYDYLSFLNTNPNYPRVNRLRYLAEHKINLKKSTPNSILKWFNESEPLSHFGKIKLGEVYISQGNIEKGSKLIKEGWIQAKLSKSDLRYLRKKYAKIITVSDNIKRADWHAWEGKHWDVQRMLRYLPKEETTLYRARQLLMSKSYGVDDAIKKVSQKYKNDIGLKYDRLKWRRRRGRVESSLEILFNTPNNPVKLIRPDIWWKERAILSRSLIYKKKYPQAYKVSSNHSLTDGPEYAEAEWLSGWIAFTFLDDPNLALEHFKNFYDNVGYPISLSRGAYWIARTYKKIKNEQKSEE